MATQLYIMLTASLFMTGATLDPDVSDSEEASGTNVGAIVGGVIGGLVLIAIIVIVVYFCWYRKRTDNYSARDSKEVGTTYTPHVPPPMFYAEPRKVNKDERDDARF